VIIGQYMGLAIGSMTAGVRATIATVHRAVYRTDGDPSVNLVYHNQHGRPCTTKRRDHNLIVRSGKSEAELSNQKIENLFDMYIHIEANYRQTRSIARPLCDSTATCHQTATKLSIFGTTILETIARLPMIIYEEYFIFSS